MLEELDARCVPVCSDAAAAGCLSHVHMLLPACADIAVAATSADAGNCISGLTPDIHLHSLAKTRRHPLASTNQALFAWAQW